MRIYASKGRSGVAALFRVLGIFFCLPGSLAAAAPSRLVSHGGYIFAAAGCAACHTDVKNKGKLLAGGAALKTPFGTFYGPNITPDPEHGIGRWSDGQFIRALRDGVSPAGEHYFPVFPYTAFSQMTDADMRALKAYIFTLAPVSTPSRAHDVRAPFSWRALQVVWKWLYFTPGPYRADAGRSTEWNRGAYLVRALVHCAECHTPRNRLGGLDHDRWLGGADDFPDGDGSPNITPDRETGIGKWSADEIALYLEDGEDPTGDYAGSLMADVIEHSTGRLSAGDRAAIVTYLRALSPIRSTP